MTWQEQAEALWGYKWKATLAETAEVTKRTVQRWNSGEFEIPSNVEGKLYETYELWREGNEQQSNSY